MRTTILGACLALILPACGGSSESIPSSLQGFVIEVDGQSADLAGVEVELKETGEKSMTDDDGSFRFDDLDPGTYTLEFDADANGSSEGDGDDGQVDEEREGDGEESSGREEAEDGEGNPRVEIKEDGEEVEIRVVIEGGEVHEYEIDNEDHRHAMESLWLRAELDLEGKAKIDQDGDRMRFRVAVHGLDAGDVIDIYMDDRSEAGSRLIGSVAANDGGEAVFERDTAEGDLLPLNAPNLDEMHNWIIEVRLDDELVLIGEVPPLPEERKEEPSEEDGKNDDEEEHEEGGDDGDEPSGEDGGEEPAADDGGDEPSGDDDGEEPAGEGDDEEPGGDGENNESGGGDETSEPS